MTETVRRSETSHPDKKARKHKKSRSSVSLADTRKLPISLNVYDLMPPSNLSSFLWYTGLSICHSGVVIQEQEWAFGGHDVEGVTGVYVTRPRDVPENAIFRVNIPIGITVLDDRHIGKVLDRLKADFTGPSYDLLNKNCNHFSEMACKALCGTSPPAWINRIAGYGAKLPLCVSEAWVNPPVAEVEHDSDEEEDSARLLPPSEVAPMQRHTEETTEEEDSASEDEMARNDRYLTEASGGRRLDIGRGYEDHHGDDAAELQTSLSAAA